MSVFHIMGVKELFVKPVFVCKTCKQARQNENGGAGYSVRGSSQSDELVNAYSAASGFNLAASDSDCVLAPFSLSLFTITATSS